MCCPEGEKEMLWNRSKQTYSLFILTVMCMVSPVLFADTTLLWNSSFTNSWTLTPDVSMLSDGAGSDYAQELFSPPYTEAVTVESDCSWSLYIEANPLLWPEGLTVSARAMAPEQETFDALQDIFVELSSTPRLLASGTGDRELIGVQYRLEGLSVSQFKQRSWNTDIYLSIMEE